MMAPILAMALIATAAAADCTSGECLNFDDVSLLQTNIKKHNSVKEYAAPPCASTCDVAKLGGGPNSDRAADDLRKVFGTNEKPVDNPALCKMLGEWFSKDGCAATCDNNVKSNFLTHATGIHIYDAGIGLGHLCCPMPQGSGPALVESSASTWQPPPCLAKCEGLTSTPPSCEKLTKMFAGCAASCDDDMKKRTDDMICKQPQMERCSASASTPLDIKKVKEACCELSIAFKKGA